MRSEQVNLFAEYSELRKISADGKRIAEIETLLIQMNLGLIFHVARRMPSIWQYKSEIKTVGMATLLKSIRTYDPTLGDFGPYAVQQLRSSDGLQSIQRFHASGPIKIPHNAFVNFLAEKKKQANDPDSECSEEYQAVDNAMSNTLRFGEVVDKSNNFPLEELIEQNTFNSQIAILEEVQVKEAMRYVLTSLDLREQQVIHLLFGLDDKSEAMDLRSAGRVLSISHTMVQKIRDKALARMRVRLLAHR